MDKAWCVTVYIDNGSGSLTYISRKRRPEGNWVPGNVRYVFHERFDPDTKKWKCGISRTELDRTVDADLRRGLYEWIKMNPLVNSGAARIESLLGKYYTDPAQTPEQRGEAMRNAIFSHGRGKKGKGGRDGGLSL